MNAARSPEREDATLGVFGGTFNPIHLGHLRAAEEVAEALGLDRVLFVPSADPPHKGGLAQPLAPAKERLAWVHAAVTDNPRFGVDALELDRTGPSFTVHTLEAIGARIAPARPVFLIGDEAFVELGTWSEPERVLALAHFAVMRRPGTERARTKGRLRDWLPPALAAGLEFAADGRSARHRMSGTQLREVPIEGLDVSSTSLRKRLREGRSTRYLIPEAARVAIEASGRYARMEAR